MGSLQDDAGFHMDEQSVAASEVSYDQESPSVLLALSATLERLVRRNEKSLKGPVAHRRLTPFHGIRPPNISILKYLQRIYKYTNCSPSCFVVGFILMDQLVHKQPNCHFMSLNVHRLMITSIMVATKILDDVHYNNAFYSRVGGISVAELNSLELDFLFRLQFQLHVTPSVFEGYCTHLERELMLAGQSLERETPVYSKSDEEESMADNTQCKQQLRIEHKVQLAAAAASADFESPALWESQQSVHDS
eukprot:c16043_g1_i1 orf=233-979(+)